MKIDPQTQIPWSTLVKSRFRSYPKSHRGDTVIQKWPAKRGKQKTENQQAWVDHFACIANTFKTPFPPQYDFAKKHIPNSRWFVRDMFYAGANGDLIGTEGERKIITPTCRVKMAATVALTSGVQKTLQPSGVDWDNNQFWNPTTNPTRITIKSAGMYMVYARVAFNAVNGSFRDVGIKLNGTTLLAIPRLWPNTANGLVGEAFDVWYFHANDYIEFVAQANTTTVTAQLQAGVVVAITPESVVDE